MGNKLKSLIGKASPAVKVYLGVGCIVLIAWIASSPHVFGNLINRFNLWRLSTSGSCREFLDLMREVQSESIREEFAERFSTCALRVAEENVEKDKKAAMLKLPASIREINKRLEVFAAGLSDSSEVLLWPIDYAKPGSNSAQGSVIYIDPSSITWTSKNSVSAVISNFFLRDFALGEGIERSASSDIVNANCLEQDYKKLCARLRELTPNQ